MTPYYSDDAAGIVVYLGDSRAMLPTFATRADVCLTDPPYDIGTHQGARALHGGSVEIVGIDFAPVDPAWVAPLLLSVTRRWVVAFCALEQLGAYQSAAGDAWVRSGTWHKINGPPQYTGDRPAQGCEGITLLHQTDRRMEWNGGGSQAHWSYAIASGVRIHPTQKPEPLMTRLVELFSRRGETVLDPFLGGGTTGVVAKRLGRKFIGVELKEAYCEAACKRIEATQVQVAFAFDAQDDAGQGSLL